MFQDASSLAAAAAAAKKEQDEDEEDEDEEDEDEDEEEGAYEGVDASCMGGQDGGKDGIAEDRPSWDDEAEEAQQDLEVLHALEAVLVC